MIAVSKYDLARLALDRWYDDPARFVEEVLGLTPWDGQREILDTIKCHDRVTCRSGHKCGKTTVAAATALWWCCTRHEARVVLIAPTFRQISEQVWREITRLYRGAKFPLGGKLFANPSAGIRWPDDRQIIGFSTDTSEGFAGFSGPILYVLDEASGVPDVVWDVASTSPLGKVLAISNPTKSDGAFYRSHTRDRGVWVPLHLSSERAAAQNPIFTLPNGRRRQLYPGIADADWLKKRQDEYGTTGFYYDVRVRGEFSKLSDMAIIPLGLVTAATERWTDECPSNDPLEIGVDAARFGPDDTCIVWRRGFWASAPIILKGNDAMTVAGEVRDLAYRLRRSGERPVIRIDTSNGYGSGPADILRRTADLQVVDCVATASATDDQHDRFRDQMWTGLGRWLSKGAIPDDARLVSDLTSPVYDYNDRGKLKIESKKEIRKRIGRSTDVGDALALAVYSDAGDATAGLVFGNTTRMPRTRW